jgi:soluble lytic murein transglycosylase-like protein
MLRRIMPRSRSAAAAGAGALILLASIPAGAQPKAEPDAVAQSNDPYVAASRASGVPVAVLVAVAGAESGFHPWALNVRGREIYCHSQQEAERILTTTGNVDIGLMQINWPFWGPRLGVSKLALLDPRTNLLYGARILKEPLSRGGNFWQRLSDYHSGNPQARDRYNQRVYNVYLAYMRGQIK